MALRQRAVVGAVSASIAVGALVLGASPASALPRQCDRLCRIADTHWLYAEASYAVGDWAGYTYWMHVYDHDMANVVASGC